MITQLNYNWFCGNNGEVAQDEFSTYTVGTEGVASIEEHAPQGEGDRLWYDIYFDDDKHVRVFNPNQVFYS